MLRIGTKRIPMALYANENLIFSVLLVVTIINPAVQVGDYRYVCGRKKLMDAGRHRCVLIKVSTYHLEKLIMNQGLFCHGLAAKLLSSCCIRGHRHGLEVGAREHSKD